MLYDDVAQSEVFRQIRKELTEGFQPARRSANADNERAFFRFGQTYFVFRYNRKRRSRFLTPVRFFLSGSKTVSLAFLEKCQSLMPDWQRSACLSWRKPWLHSRKNNGHRF